MAGFKYKLQDVPAMFRRRQIHSKVRGKYSALEGKEGMKWVHWEEPERSQEGAGKELERNQERAKKEAGKSQRRKQEGSDG